MTSYTRPGAIASGVFTPTDGWVSDTATWTFATAATFTVVGDETAKFQKGTRIKLTQTTVKYFVVVGSSFAAGTTTVTITGGDDYALASAAISDTYYSYAASPEGYPDWFDFSASVNPTGYSAITTEILRFRIIGKHCFVLASFDGTSNATTLTFTLPVTTHALGSNNLYAMGFVRNNGTVATTPGRLALATSSTTGTMTRDMAGAAWTGSGQKTAVAIFDYEF